MAEEKLGFSLLVCTLLLLFLPSVVSLTKCTKIDSCRASTDKGTIDLGPLASTGNRPRFSNIKDNRNESNTYSWNPCKPWTEVAHNATNTCQDIAVCLAVEHKAFFGIGKANTANFELDSSTGSCAITYTGSIKLATAVLVQTKVQIYLECSKNEEGRLDAFIHPHSIKTSDNLSLIKTTLHSKYACPHKGLSAGSVLLIIFFSVLFIYLFGGMLFLKFSRGATGKELLPNYSFWAYVVLLIQEGCVFTVDKARGLCSLGKTDYQAI